MNNSLGEDLIIELYYNPIGFNEKGKAYQLLQEYFNGFPLETLRPLFSSNDIHIQSVAAFIASELGREACPLIHDIIPLLNIDNRSIQYDSLESIMVCSFGNNVSEFKHVIHSMQSNDEVIRVLAMYLVSNADFSQFQAAIQLLGTNDPYEISHKQGLSILLEENMLDSEKILKIMNDKEPIIRKYGAIAAQRLHEKFPNLIRLGVSSKDPDIQKFSQKVLDLNP